MSAIDTGTWVLRPNQDYRNLVSRLNVVLYRKRLVLTLCDPVITELSTTGFDCMIDKARYVDRTPHPFEKSSIYLPIGMGIDVWTEPFSCQQDEHFSIMKIDGDHVQIAKPYSPYIDGYPVCWQRYSITAIGDMR